MSGVNIETIRRIEAGKVLPKLDTLEYLSPVLKEDLHAILLKCRLDDYQYFYTLKTRLEHKIDSGNFAQLEAELSELEQLRESIKNSYYKNSINQLMLLISAALSFKRDDEPQTALDKLIQAIKISTPEFCLEKYASHTFSSLELRVLMNIAIVLSSLGRKNINRDILEFCANNIDQEDNLFPKILYNLAVAYFRDQDFENSLKHVTIAIDWSIKNRIYSGLNLMYYHKGISQFHLGIGDYADSIKKALLLCDLYNQPDLKHKMLSNCRKIFGMEDDFSTISLGT